MRTWKPRSRQDESGAIAIIVALSMTALVGAMALVADIGLVYVTRSELQTASDAAALAGTNALVIEDPDPTGVASGLSSANTPGQGTVTLSGDIVVGNWDDSTKTFMAGGTPANAMQVSSHRSSDHGNSVQLLFASVIGRDNADVHAVAVAAALPATVGDIVPASLRSPSFGPVDPEIVEESPGKAGPSQPGNGQEFVEGEEVIVFTYGKGKQSPVHLVLDIPGVDIDKVLRGEISPPRIEAGDTYPVIGEGTGQGGLGSSLEDRLDFPTSDSRRHILVPVLEELPGSRDVDGELTGNVLVADMTAVFLDRIQLMEVPDPENPDNPIEIRVLIGYIEKAVSSAGGGGGDVSGVGGGLVTAVKLVE